MQTCGGKRGFINQEKMQTSQLIIFTHRRRPLWQACVVVILEIQLVAQLALMFSILL